MGQVGYSGYPGWSFQDQRIEGRYAKILLFISIIPNLFMQKNAYLGFAVAGLFIPYSQLVFFLIENGLNLPLMIDQIVNYRISTFAWLDVVISASVVIFMVYDDRERIQHLYMPVIATLLIGPSCGLPLYLYLRSR